MTQHHLGVRPLRRPRRLSRALALALVAGLLAMGAAGLLPATVLTLLPALALVLVMLTRPYLGERTLAKLRAAYRTRRRPVARVAPGMPRRRGAVHVRGGRLIASALAGRAPPALLLAAHHA
jgi:hypothetical protein